MNSIELLSTDCVHQQDRPKFWQTVLRDKFGLQSQVEKGPAFSATLECGQWNEVRLFRLSAAGYYVQRTSSEAGAHFVKIAYQISGSSSFDQNGQCVHLQPGEWTVYDDTQPYSSSNPDHVQLLILLIPRHRMESRSIDLLKTMGRRLSAREGVAKLAFSFILNLFDQMADVPLELEADLIDIIAHLLILSLVTVQTNVAMRSSSELLRERIKGYILENLRNPTLSIEQIAIEMGCSRRYLHRAFQGESTTIADFIWKMRLARSSEDLRLNKRSITEVAYSWGFNSSAHFSTLFKEHFGLTPRAYRSAKGAAASVTSSYRQQATA